ncbi:MAG: EpsG family protein [Rickettsiales bacterium]|nr:EpsG family protein [Rickettsiales bacterium]
MMAAVPTMLGYNSQSMRASSGIALYWRFIGFLLMVLIGFRYEVGGDWSTYMEYLERVRYLSFFEAMQIEDPGYIVFNVLSAKLGLGIAGVNSLCAIIVVTGLFAFLRTLPRPWLGLVCAIPYLVIVVGMGYTRQSVALGLVMLGMVAIKRSDYRKFVFWVLLGVAFHKTAVLLLPMAALISTQSRIQKIGIVALASIVSFNLFLADQTDYLYDTYIDNQDMSSEGALVRLLINAIPGAIFLVLSRRFKMTLAERTFWKHLSWLSLLMLVLLFVTGFSTALDRMALYLIPLQLLVFAHFPEAVKGNRGGVILAVILYYAVILIVWLNFAAHAKYWLPYQLGIG